MPASQTLVYGTNNRITSINYNNNLLISYDADGNMTSDGTNQYLYDAEGRPTTATNIKIWIAIQSSKLWIAIYCGSKASSL